MPQCDEGVCQPFASLDIHLQHYSLQMAAVQRMVSTSGLLTPTPHKSTPASSMMSSSSLVSIPRLLSTCPALLTDCCTAHRLPHLHHAVVELLEARRRCRASRVSWQPNSSHSTTPRSLGQELLQRASLQSLRHPFLHPQQLEAGAATRHFLLRTTNLRPGSQTGCCDQLHTAHCTLELRLSPSLSREGHTASHTACSTALCSPLDSHTPFRHPDSAGCSAGLS